MTLLRNILRQYSLIEATTAEEALRLFAKHGRQIDLLVAAVNLPTSSGIQVALLLRSEMADLPVLLTSGYPWSDRDSADLRRLGTKSVAVLEKPYRSQVLRDAVGELLGAPPAEVVRTA